jgi:ferredoxin-NADP reductase
MAFKTFPLRVEKAERITPSILCLGFRRDDGLGFDYKPGQFINIHFETDGESTHRSYSVANAPDPGGLIEIAISPVTGGKATDFLFALKPGDCIEGSGPYGRFVLKDDPACRYVLVGTGTGITPYRAMLPELARRVAKGVARVHILLGVWRRDELLFGKDFEAFAGAHEGVRFQACYSREMPSDAQIWETHGYVQRQFDALELDPEQDIVYLCGNPNMVDEAAAYLKERGFPVKRIRREKYVSANA